MAYLDQALNAEAVTPNNNADLTPEELTQVLMESGSPLAPNPVQDVNDYWFISEQEWNYPEWQSFKVQYP